MPALRDVQTAFRRALLEDDDAALAALIDPGSLGSAPRIGVYKNNVFVSLTRALGDTFPAVCRHVDERFFAYAAHQFIARHPPERAWLSAYGSRFPEFLAAFPPCRELPYLADVARLEWLMNCAATAEDAAPISAATPAGIAADEAPRLVCRLHPAFAYLASPWPVDRIWRANRGATAAVGTLDLGAGGVRLEVSRRGDDVVMRALEGAQFGFRDALARAATLEAAAATALAIDPAFDVAIALAALFGDGAVVATALAPERAP